jgi:hypothetical protein
MANPERPRCAASSLRACCCLKYATSLRISLVLSPFAVVRLGQGVNRATAQRIRTGRRAGKARSETKPWRGNVVYTLAASIFSSKASESPARVQELSTGKQPDRNGHETRRGRFISHDGYDSVRCISVGGSQHDQVFSDLVGLGAGDIRPCQLLQP